VVVPAALVSVVPEVEAVPLLADGEPVYPDDAVASLDGVVPVLVDDEAVVVDWSLAVVSLLAVMSAWWAQPKPLAASRQTRANESRCFEDLVIRCSCGG
jgi:hypothetical protein